MLQKISHIKAHKVPTLFIVVVLWAGLIFAYWYVTPRPICPDDFKNEKEKIAAFEKWIYTEFKPKSNETFFEDLQKVRREFYIKNNCTNALKRMDEFMNATAPQANTENVVE